MSRDLVSHFGLFIYKTIFVVTSGASLASYLACCRFTYIQDQFVPSGTSLASYLACCRFYLYTRPIHSLRDKFGVIVSLLHLHKISIRFEHRNLLIYKTNSIHLRHSKFTYIQDHFIQSNRNNELFRKKRNQNNTHLSAVKIKGGGVEINRGWVWKLKGGGL